MDTVVVVTEEDRELLSGGAHIPRKRKECKHLDCTKQAVVKDYCQQHARGNVDSDLLDKYVEKKKVSQKKLCTLTVCIREKFLIT